MTKEDGHPRLVGHSLIGNKRLRSVEDVAKFICEHGRYYDVTVTYDDGRPFLSTYGMYVNQIEDAEYRERLFEVLVPMQRETLRRAAAEEIEEEGNDMNEWERERRRARIYQERYPSGTRLLLQFMGRPCPVESGTRGTVIAVDDMGTVHCTFDNGRNLGLIPGEDSFRPLTEEELSEEQEENNLEQGM